MRDILDTIPLTLLAPVARRTDGYTFVRSICAKGRDSAHNWVFGLSAVEPGGGYVEIAAVIVAQTSVNTTLFSIGTVLAVITCS